MQIVTVSFQPFSEVTLSLETVCLISECKTAVANRQRCFIKRTSRIFQHELMCSFPFHSSFSMGSSYVLVTAFADLAQFTVYDKTSKTANIFFLLFLILACDL